MTRRLCALLPLLCVLAFSQSPGPSFEAATIKPSQEAAGHSSSHSRTSYLVMKNMTLKELVADAYKLSLDRISGGPKWVDSDRFNIEARAAGPAEDPELHLMLRSLLAERFQFTSHRETKNLTGYALTVGKGGMKIKPDESGADSHSDGSRTRLNVQRYSLDQLATFLSRRLGEPVVNATDNKSLFTFTLEWSPEPARRPDAPDSAAADAPSGPSIFTALQDTLGLKLESRKLPIEVLVIDKAEKPTEN